MRFKYFPYQAKGEPYRAALLEAGFIETSGLDVDFVLIDRAERIVGNEIVRKLRPYIHLPIVLYPHAPTPLWWYDGLVSVPDSAVGAFVVGEGQKRVMQIVTPELRVEASGWAWCDIVPFRAPRKVKNILFAPIHPSGGVPRLRPEAFDANRAIFETLKKHENEFDITVRYVGDLRIQGLEWYHKFEMVEGGYDNSIVEIDSADLVIAESTFMFLSVARGVPTIGINQRLPIRPNKDSELYSPARWNEYVDDVAYPIDFGDAPFLELIERAMTEQTRWRNDFIGAPMDGRAFAASVRSMVENAYARAVR